MKMTPKKLETILRRYRDLVDLAKLFNRGKSNNMRIGPIRFDYDGNIECEINTSCHCHPEYRWVVVGTKEEFSEWVINKQ
jgi:hypothetical protein